MTEQADVIIIGAGIMGSATAYHLARRKYGG
jgi:glycine/D-amino acid oxidase-like deaminating enzyme